MNADEAYALATSYSRGQEQLDYRVCQREIKKAASQLKVEVEVFVRSKLCALSTVSEQLRAEGFDVSQTLTSYYIRWGRK